jgi:hypothetical protein
MVWRFGRLAKPLAEGLRKFPGLDLPFHRVGHRAWEQYEAVNERLMSWAHNAWPDEPNAHGCLWQFLLQLAFLHLDQNRYNHYWIISSHEQPPEEGVWSANEHVKAGDLVVFYSSETDKAITDLYRVQGQPSFRPVSGWSGFWMSIKRAATLENIPFGDLKSDDVLGEWGIVRAHMQGVTIRPIPHRMYNRLLDLFPDDVVGDLGLEHEPLDQKELAGTFGSEREFEQEVVEPLIDRLDFRRRRQKSVRIRIGSSPQTLAVDHLVSDDHGPLTLFENKLQIRDDEELKEARDQAKSYALQLGLPSCIVAAPEGIWVYETVPGDLTQRAELAPSELREREEELRELLIELGEKRVQ